MALILAGVTYAYSAGRQHAIAAVTGVDFAIEPGEIVLLIGATGSGKSTLLRLASGLLEPQAGEGTIDGEPLGPRTARGRVGLIFQDAESQLFADTLADDVAFGPRNLGVPAEEARAVSLAALAEVGLDPGRFASRSPFSLSGGEARRAAIAGVLAMRPRYVLADEPTAGLDASGRRAVRDLLVRTAATSGVVIVSHHAEEFLAVANRVVVLANGAVAWQGSAADAITDPGVFLDGGLVPPTLLEVQRELVQRGLTLDRIELDPVKAAASVAAALAKAGRA